MSGCRQGGDERCDFVFRQLFLKLCVDLAGKGFDCTRLVDTGTAEPFDNNQDAFFRRLGDRCLDERYIANRGFPHCEDLFRLQIVDERVESGIFGNNVKEGGNAPVKGIVREDMLRFTSTFDIAHPEWPAVLASLRASDGPVVPAPSALLDTLVSFFGLVP